MLQVVYIFELRIAIASGLGGSRCTHRLKPLQTMEILKPPWIPLLLWPVDEFVPFCLATLTVRAPPPELLLLLLLLLSI